MGRNINQILKQMKNIYVINGINSELAQLFIKNLSNRNIIFGFHRSLYKGIKKRNILLTNSINDLPANIENKCKGKKKLFFLILQL